MVHSSVVAHKHFTPQRHHTTPHHIMSAVAANSLESQPPSQSQSQHSSPPQSPQAGQRQAGRATPSIDDDSMLHRRLFSVATPAPPASPSSPAPSSPAPHAKKRVRPCSIADSTVVPESAPPHTCCGCVPAVDTRLALRYYDARASGWGDACAFVAALAAGGIAIARVQLQDDADTAPWRSRHSAPRAAGATAPVSLELWTTASLSELLAVAETLGSTGERIYATIGRGGVYDNERTERELAFYKDQVPAVVTSPRPAVPDPVVSAQDAAPQAQAHEAQESQDQRSPEVAGGWMAAWH